MNCDFSLRRWALLVSGFKFELLDIKRAAMNDRSINITEEKAIFSANIILQNDHGDFCISSAVYFGK